MKKIKCAKCNKQVEVEKVHKMGKSEYCPSCYEVVSKEEKERRRLIGYICKIFKITKPSPMMFAQIKNFNKQGISYREIRITLNFLVSVENFKLDKKYGIGIVKYRHKDAMEYYKKAKQRKDEMEIIEYETNNIQMSFNKTNRNRYLESKIINIEDIMEGE